MSLLSRLFKRKPKSSVEGLFADAAQTPPALAKAKSVRAAKPAKPSSMDAGLVQLVDDGTGSVLIAFGLRWRTLVTTGGRDAAQKLAQTAKATHYLFRSQQVAYGALPKEAQGQIFPASLLAAKANAGVAIFALTLAEGQYWFAVVRNGQPTNTDEVVSGLAEHQAVARIRSIAQQFDGEVISVFADIRNSGIDGQKEFTLHDIFDVVRTDDDRLLKLQNKQSTNPKPIMYATLVAVALLGTQRGYSEWKDYQKRKADAENRVVEESPEVAWAPVLATFLNGTPSPNVKAIVEIRRSLSRLPVVWAGWSLTGARCQAAETVNAQKQRPWSCQASFDRGRVADTSAQILKRINTHVPEWIVTFPSINTLVITWPVSHTEQSIELADLGDPNSITIKIASQLQDYFPALSARPEFKMAAFELTPPLRKDGKPHPKPATIPVLFKGDLALKGPLRSIDAMTQQLSDVQWDSVGLVFDGRSSPSQKGLTTSALNVELIGKVFGKK